MLPSLVSIFANGFIRRILSYVAPFAYDKTTKGVFPLICLHLFSLFGLHQRHCFLACLAARARLSVNQSQNV